MASIDNREFASINDEDVVSIDNEVVMMIDDEVVVSIVSEVLGLIDDEMVVSIDVEFGSLISTSFSSRSHICPLNLNVCIFDLSVHGFRFFIRLSVDNTQHLTESRHQFLFPTFNHLV